MCSTRAMCKAQAFNTRHSLVSLYKAVAPKTLFTFIGTARLSQLEMIEDENKVRYDLYWLPKVNTQPRPLIIDLTCYWTFDNINLRSPAYVNNLCSFRTTRHTMYFTDEQALELSRAGMRQTKDGGICYCHCCGFAISHTQKWGDAMLLHAKTQPYCSFINSTGCIVDAKLVECIRTAPLVPIDAKKVVAKYFGDNYLSYP